jgi:tRNA dimethylallyltransferase
MYKGLPIATNKIPIHERKSIPHHLLDCIDLKEKPWEVGTFRRNAIKVVEEIRSREHLPILVGGTHYYTQAMLFRDAIVDDDGVRDCKGISLEEKWPVLGASNEDMLQELRRVDPVMAARWHPQDGRKIRRSLEIYLTTGKTASEIYEQQRKRKTSSNIYQVAGQVNSHNATTDEAQNGTHEAQSPLLFDPIVLWVHADPDVLEKRLDQRVDEMVEYGLLSEVESMYAFLQELESEGTVLDQTCGIWAAIGYKEFRSYLAARHSDSASENTLEDLKQKGIELIKTATRKYARYQARWIRLTLQNAIADHQLENNFFLLDGTDLTRWSQDIDKPAARLIQTFLKGEPLPPPVSLSNAAERVLVLSNKRDRRARHCQICDKTMMSDVEWDRHVRGKKHVSNLKPKIDWRALYPRKGNCQTDTTNT